MNRAAATAAPAMPGAEELARVSDELGHDAPALTAWALGLGQRLFQRLAHLPLPNVALRLEAHARIQGQALLLHAGGHVDGIGQALSHGGHQLRQPADQLRDKLFSRLAGQTHLRGICRRRCHVRSWASPGGPEEAGLHHGASVRVVGIVLFAGLDQVFALDAQPHGDGRRHEYR